MLPAEFLGDGKFWLDGFVLDGEMKSRGLGVLRVEPNRGQPVQYWKTVQLGLIPSDCKIIVLTSLQQRTIKMVEVAKIKVKKDKLICILVANLSCDNQNLIEIGDCVEKDEYPDLLMLDDGRVFCNQGVITHNNLNMVIKSMAVSVEHSS